MKNLTEAMEKGDREAITETEDSKTSYYKVTVTSNTIDTVEVTTYVRATPAEGGDGT